MKNLNVCVSLILVLMMGTAASAQTVDDVIAKATDGTDYWMSRGGQVTDMPDNAKEQFGSSFNQYSASGVAELIGNGSFTYSGSEDVNGIRADVVQGAFTGSGDVSMYFDEAGLPFRMLMPIEGGEMDMYMSDYHEVGGIKIAYKFESLTNGSLEMVLEASEAEANIDIDPSVFTRPAQ